MRRLFQLVALLLLVAAAWLAWALLLPVKPAAPQFLMLRPGWSARHIARELKAAGVIRSEPAFLLAHYAARRRSLKAGEYKFEQSANALAVHARLVRGDVYVHTVVIPEGFNMFEIAASVEQAGLGTRYEFLNVARGSPALISDLDPQATSLEGDRKSVV